MSSTDAKCLLSQDRGKDAKVTLVAENVDNVIFLDDVVEILNKGEKYSARSFMIHEETDALL